MCNVSFFLECMPDSVHFLSGRNAGKISSRFLVAETTFPLTYWVPGPSITSRQTEGLKITYKLYRKTIGLPSFMTLGVFSTPAWEKIHDLLHATCLKNPKKLTWSLFFQVLHYVSFREGTYPLLGSFCRRETLRLVVAVPLPRWKVELWTAASLPGEMNAIYT